MEIMFKQENETLFEQRIISEDTFDDFDYDDEDDFDEADEDFGASVGSIFNNQPMYLRLKLEVSKKYHNALNFILRALDLPSKYADFANDCNLVTELVPRIDLDSGKICLNVEDLWLINRFEDGCLKDKLLSDPIIEINTSNEYLNYFARNYNASNFLSNVYKSKKLNILRCHWILVTDIIKEKNKMYIELEVHISSYGYFDMFKHLGIFIGSLSENNHIEKIWIQERGCIVHPLEIIKDSDYLFIKGTDHKNIKDKYDKCKIVLNRIFGEGVKIKPLDMADEYDIEFEGEIPPEIYESIKLCLGLNNKFYDYMHNSSPKEFNEIDNVMDILRTETDQLLKYTHEDLRFKIFDIPKDLLEAYIKSLDINSDRKDKIKDILIDNFADNNYDDYLKEINSYGRYYTFIDSILDLEYFEVVESPYKDSHGLLKFKCRSLAYNEEDLKQWFSNSAINIKKQRVVKHA